MTERKSDENMTNSSECIPSKILPYEILSQDGVLKYDFITSLQNIVGTKVVSNLWMNLNTQQRIIDMFHKRIQFPQCYFSDDWSQIKTSVFTQVSELFLPKSIKEKLTNLVPLAGNSIYNWVIYNDVHILETNRYTKYSAVDEISNISWSARGKIDYAQTAKNILSNPNTSLSDDHKYKLACTYCLENEIAILAPHVVGPFYLDSIKVDIHPMVYFWTAHITGDNTKLYNPYYNDDYNRRNSNMSINEHIMQLLINVRNGVKSIFNQVPIIYMWKKLSGEEKARNITFIVEVCNQDFRYSLLSNLDYEMQQNVFKECSYTILSDILNDWLWEEYFLPTALHVLDIMDPLYYLPILKDVSDKINMNYMKKNKYLYNMYKSIFMQLWKEGSRHFKIFEYDNGRSLQRLVSSSLSWAPDMDVIEFILMDLDKRQKKLILFGFDGFQHCVNLMKCGLWDSLELLIKNTLSTEYVHLLKQTLLINTARAIAVHLLNTQALDKVEHFMSWVFETEEEIDKFRKTLLDDICETLLESIIANNTVDFTEIESYLKWYAKGDIQVINQFKNPKYYFGRICIRNLIEQDKYELLEIILTWCFSNNQQQIADFKSNMYKVDCLSSLVRSLTCRLIKKDVNFKMLDKFILWCFTNEQEIKEFKMWVLFPQKNRFSSSLSVCSELIDDFDYYQLKVADNFIKWCVSSSKEVSKFKNTLMLSSDMEFIIDPARRISSYDLKLLIKWFNPCSETVQKFKKHFSEDFPSNLFEFLDEFIESRNSRRWKSGLSTSL